MIDTSIAKISQIYIHQIGSEDNPQAYKLTESAVYIYDKIMESMLFDFVKRSYDEHEQFSFKSVDGQFINNPIFNSANAFFTREESEHVQLSQQIAVHLANSSRHNSIRSGQLIVAKIEELIINDEIVSALMIIKSERKQNFLKIRMNGNEAVIDLDKGINSKKIDKSCIIFNMLEEEGYRACVKDNISKQEMAVFWKEHFLNVEQKMTDYQYTQVYMKGTDDFINHYASQTNELSKEEELELKGRSADYFQKNESFDLNEYQNAVFSDTEMQSAFQEFSTENIQTENSRVPQEFEVSQKSVANNSKYFRSVIKLDRNFHIYVHGNRNMIEKGTDEEGRQFYKLYFKEEN